jgi:hypothetical protein
MKSSQYQINSVVLLTHLSTLAFHNPYEKEKEKSGFRIQKQTTLACKGEK